jgi:16S rRNA (guanine966-N2)-methyltransferase
MRIIAGELRGRKILPPEGMETRPVTDRVKQSVFDIIAPLLPEARIYDCFAGTGSMGLESLSRGAKHVVFFEADRAALSILRQNVGALGVADRSQVVSGDLFEAVRRRGAEKIDVVFLDPPYRFLTERAGELQELAAILVEKCLAPEATVVFRHDVTDSLDLAPLRRYDQRTYGGMAVELLTCPSIPTSISPPPTPPG